MSHHVPPPLPTPSSRSLTNNKPIKWTAQPSKLTEPQSGHSATSITSSHYLLFSTAGTISLHTHTNSPNNSTNVKVIGGTCRSRREASATLLEGNIYLIGGYDDRTGELLNSVERLNLHSVDRYLSSSLSPDGGWCRMEEVTSLNEARKGAMSISLGGISYVFGGYDGRHECLSSVECYFDESDGASTTSSREERKKWRRERRGRHRIVKKYKYKNRRWNRNITPMPRSRAYGGIAAVGRKIYLIGGQTTPTVPTDDYNTPYEEEEEEGGSSFLSSVDVFDVDSNGWSDGPDLPVRLYGMDAFSVEYPSSGGVERFIAVVGGYDATRSVRSDKTFLLPVHDDAGTMMGGGWREAGVTLNTPRNFHTTTYLPHHHQIITMGGLDKDVKALDTIERISWWTLLSGGDVKWTCTKLRLLNHYGRATLRSHDVNGNDGDGDGDLTYVTDFVTDVNDDIFRTVLEEFVRYD